MTLFFIGAGIGTVLAAIFLALVLVAAIPFFFAQAYTGFVEGYRKRIAKDAAARAEKETRSAAPR